MGEQIKAIRFDIEQIGKHVKGSKKKFTWIFSLNNKNHTIVVDFSFISGKVKVVVDRKTLLENQLPTNVSFQHPFTLDGYALNILQQGQTFELRINNKVFSHLYNQVKTNTEFKKYEDEIKDIKVNEAQFQGNAGRKITLNIGGVGGGMKKKNYKSSTQSQNWGNFGGNEMGFPNYFGETTTTSTSSDFPQKNVAASNNFSSLLDGDEEEKSQKKVEQSEDFLDFSKQADKPVIKKTEEIDFFADNSEPEKPTSPSEQHLYRLRNQNKVNKQSEEFNTMQNLFSTMNVQSQQNPQKPQKSSLDFFDEPVQASSSIQNTQNTNLPNINLNDFNTMQQLFATSNPGQQNFNLTQNNPPISQYQQPQQFFNTAAYGQPSSQQNMFSTSVPAKKESNPFDLLDGHIQKFKEHTTKNQGSVPPPKVSNDSSNIQSINLQDFNTMQNLFKTQNPSQNQNVPQNQQIDDFNTMDNLFKTVNNQGPQTVTNPQDFNTMQNLFSTQTNVQSNSPPKQEPPSQPVSAFGKKSQPLEEDLL